MKKTACILFLFPLLLSAQDKLFFNNGKTAVGLVVGVGRDIVFFKNYDTSIVTQHIPKTALMMIEKQNGTRYIFSETPEPAPHQNSRYRNIIGAQPLALLTGRGTLVYEQLTADGRIGVAFPLSITYSVFRNSGSLNPNNPPVTGANRKGINFIGGVDVNFYLKQEPFNGFFIGPRARYGTDMFFLNTEAFTLQTQIGYCANEPDERFVQHISMGFGFAKIFSSASLNVMQNRLYAWFSINYRVGFKW
ncbi:MAG: hypothetical protein KF900_12075 [Bacteroidetes bacterium]|nr:hypothetical protein [Bacteroidota bacterium]